MSEAVRAQDLVWTVPPVERARALAVRFAQTAARFDESGELPAENFAALHRSGLIGLTAPVSHGGAGVGLAEAAEVIRVIAGGEPSTALILFMQYHNLAGLPRGRWSPALVAEVLADAVRNGSLINSLRVEPELGSPSRGGLPETTARRTDSGWTISGRKIYSTGSTALGWMIVWARTDEPEPRVGRFLVPAGSPGVTIVPSWDSLGMRATASHDVLFDEVAIPHRYAADVRLPQEWQGKEPVDAAWHAALLSSVYHGIACTARDWLVDFLNERVPSNLGKPLSSLPRFQQEVGRIEQQLLVNETMIGALARDIDEGRVPSNDRSSLTKVTVTENAISAVELALRLTGNHGISRNNPLERHYRNVLCGRIHTPQDDSALVAAGKSALGQASSEHLS